MAESEGESGFRPAAHPRRVSSTPDLRDGMHALTVGRPYRNHANPWMEDFVMSDPATWRADGVSDPANPTTDDDADITEVQQREMHPHNPSAASLQIPPMRPISPVPEPPPSWDDFPPLPGHGHGGIFSIRFWHSKIRIVFGYEGKVESRELIRLTWKLAFYVVQFIISITLLVISGQSKSPVDPTLSEWTACSRPLGPWACVWIIRLAIASVQKTWSWQRVKLARINANSRPGDVERPVTVSEDAAITTPNDGTSNPTHESHTSDGLTTEAASPQQPTLPRALLYRRLSMFLALISLTWWFTAQILLYTSVSSCRFTSPHLWWLVFGLICMQYLVLLEVFVVAFAVLVVGPMLLLILNFILLCMGRQPVAPPTRINPEIGKLSKETVARIPLVLYIPPPHKLHSSSPVPDLETPMDSPTYPPAIYDPGNPPEKVEEATNTKPLPYNGIFQLFTRGSGQSPTRKFSLGGARKTKAKDSWEDQWEKGSYPFVKLSGTRATCHICLEEFEEPRRRKDRSNRDTLVVNTEIEEKPVDGQVSPTQSRPRSKFRRKSHKRAIGEDPLQLEDAGEGAQPLRLLACSHVFHRTCIDPWLVDVSGRCPVCQRPVELDTPKPTSENGAHAASS